MEALRVLWGNDRDTSRVVDDALLKHPRVHEREPSWRPRFPLIDLVFAEWGSNVVVIRFVRGSSGSGPLECPFDV